MLFARWLEAGRKVGNRHRLPGMPSFALLLSTLCLSLLVQLPAQAQEAVERDEKAARGIELNAASFRGYTVYFSERTTDLAYLVLVDKDVPFYPSIRVKDGITTLDFRGLGVVVPGSLPGKTELIVMDAQGLRQGQMSPFPEVLFEQWLGTKRESPLLGQIVDFMAQQADAFELQLGALEAWPEKGAAP